MSQSLKIESKMPKAMDGKFFGLEFAGIEINADTREELRNSFAKFSLSDNPGSSELMNPA